MLFYMLELEFSPSLAGLSTSHGRDEPLGMKNIVTTLERGGVELVGRQGGQPI